MESLLAAYGSGAAKLSHELARPVLNVDIGGGTTKLALVEGGRVVHTAAIHLGGRLVAGEAAGEGLRVTRQDPTGHQLAENAGLHFHVGDTVSGADLDQLAEWMADALIAALTQFPAPAAVEALWLTDPLEPVEGIAGVMFSGGVGEYVYGREERDFGDLGRRLGLAIRRRVDRGCMRHALLPAGECIRATAIGASEYSVQLSGNTVYISNPGALLPRKNLQVVQPDIDLSGAIDAARVSQAIRRHFAAFDLKEGEAEVAIAFRWQGAPSFERLSALARGIVEALPMTTLEARPIYLVLDGDIAHSLGALLKEEWGLASEILVIDGVSLWDFDYIDLGRVRMPSHTVPVTIKSLVFSEDPRGPKARAGRAHEHGDGHGHSHGPGHHQHSHGSRAA
jgi:ethanolamine utilization protein EutA